LGERVVPGSKAETVQGFVLLL
jgi:hypothetical protein